MINNQKGVTLFLTIIIMSVMLSIAVGLNALLFTQFKTLSQSGNSVLAFYAADSGAEYVIKVAKSGATPQAVYTDIDVAAGGQLFSNGAHFNVTVSCCASGKCQIVNNCPAGLQVRSDCQASLYCAKAVGEFGGTKRAIEANM